MNITKTIIMPATPLRATVLLGSILSLVGSAQGALLWNATSDFATSGGVEGGAAFGSTFTTQTFTPSGSSVGSVHNAGDLARITLNFNGMTVNSGPALETLDGRLDHSGLTGADSRIVLRTTTSYTAGDVLTFNFSWANQMVSQDTVDQYGGSSTSDFGGSANIRNMLLWDTALDPVYGIPFHEITYDLYGDNVGNATNEFYDGFAGGDPLAPFTKVSDDHAQVTYALPVNGGDPFFQRLNNGDIWVNDIVGTAGDIDDFAIESYSISVTIGDNNPFNAIQSDGSFSIASGTEFIFTFDGISNGIEVAEAVPEPSGYLLLALGSLGLIARRKRRS